MDVQNEMNDLELFNEENLFRPTDRTIGSEWEIITTSSPQLVTSMRNKGFSEDLIEEENNGLYGYDTISEIKTLPFGFGSESDSVALRNLKETVDELYKSAQEVNAKVKIDSIDKRRGHTAGNHIHISGNGFEDLMKVANIMQAYEAMLMIIANPDNRSRIETFGFRYGIAIAHGQKEKMKNKKYDIMIDLSGGLTELRSIPMSKDLNTAFMVDLLTHRLISMAESNPEEMLRVEYLTNESPDGKRTYAEINRDRAITEGLNAYLYDVKFVMEENSLKVIPYERHISKVIDEYLTRVGDYQQFIFD